MKKLKYLLLLILFIPVVAFAEPIHLTQSAIDELLANPNVDNSTYNAKVIPNGWYPGIYLNGEEYILDEDIDLNRTAFVSAANGLTINLNGHTITNRVSSSYSQNYFVTITTYTEHPADVTINGPGTIEYYKDTTNDCAIKMYGGNLTLNNVTIDGFISNQQDLEKSTNTQKVYGKVSINNSKVTRQLEIWGGELYIESSEINYDESHYPNRLYSVKNVINNSTIESYLSNAISLCDSSNNSTCELTLTNSKLIAKTDGIWVQGASNIVLDNVDMLSETSIYFGDESPVNLTMSNVHMKTNCTDYECSVMYGAQDVNKTAQEFYEALLKDGYIYWDEPNFYTDTRNLKYIKNTEMWVIKQEQDYNVSQEPVYIVPNSNDIVLSIPGEVELLEGVEVDDDELDDNQYTAEEDKDNVNIKLEDSYLQTLDEGEYTIKVLFANGEATTTLVVTNEDPNTIVEPTSAEVKGEEETNPNTGLKNYMLLLIPLLISGVIYLVISKITLFKSI